MNKQKTLLGVCIIIIILFTIYKFGCYQTEMYLLPGFWESNSEFNITSNLHLFTFYISESSNLINIPHTYSAYILMIENNQDQTILINEPVVIQLTPQIKCDTISKDNPREFTVNFTNMESELIPHKLNMRFYPETCKLVLYDSTKIYAVFYKNLVMSELEKINNESKSHSKSESNIDVDTEQLY